MATRKTERRSYDEVGLYNPLSADEYLRMWEQSYELQRREVEALERIATLLDRFLQAAPHKT